MLDKIIFGIGGYFLGYKQIKVWVENGKIYKSSKGDFNDPDGSYTREVSIDELKSLEIKLAELKINSWKKEYMNPDILDGT